MAVGRTAYDVRAPTKKGQVSKKPSKGAPTDLNIYALADMFHYGELKEVPNRLHATDVPHIRRCLKAGLVDVVRKGKTTVLKLTPPGVAAIKAYEQRWGRI